VDRGQGARGAIRAWVKARAVASGGQGWVTLGAVLPIGSSRTIGAVLAACPLR
jgi:hypothetical protein